MSNEIDFLKLGTIKINSEKYGEVCFSRISEKLSDIISSVKNTPENIFEILMKNSFYEELNTIKKEDVDFSKFTETEKNDFYEQFLPLQFESYKIDENISDYENFKKAINFGQHQTNDRYKQLNKMIIKTQMNMSMALSGCNMNQIIADTNRAYQQLQKNGIYSERIYSNLSNALKGLSGISSLSEQIRTLTKNLNIPYEQYKSALKFIPDNYSISKILQGETGEIDIFVQDPEKENEYNLNNAEADIGFFKFLRDISEMEVIKFLTHLQEYPYLALIDDTGKKIFEAVQGKIQECVNKEKDKIFYRARAREKGQPHWTPVQMGMLQYGFPGMNRYNFIGKPRLYITSEIETAKKEVENENEPESTVMKLKQIKEMTVFDISTEDCHLVTYCNLDKNKDNDYTAYLIPNFLSICCSYLNKQKRHSVDAIKYKSNKNPNGFCYVILDESPFDFFEKGEIVSESTNED